MADDRPAAVKAERLHEARDYLGFSQDDVAGAMDRERGWVDDIEHGRQRVTGEELRKLSRLYQRPVAWLCGETTFQPGPELLRQVEHLDEGDREAMLDFAEFLEGAKRAPQPRAYTHFPPESGMDDQAAEDNGIIG
jgi:transcriptional regulator with XRE-family HTH domain